MRQLSLTDNTPSPTVRNTSGYVSFYADGTFDGDVSVQASPDGTTWFDIADSSLSAKGIVNINVDAPYLRVVNSGAAPALTCWISGR